MTTTKWQHTWRRSFSTLGCSELSLDEILALAARHSLETVELRFVANRLDLPALFREQGLTGEELRSRFSKTGVRCAALDASFRLFQHTPADRAELTAFGEWAEALEAPFIRIFDGGPKGEILADAALDEGAATLAWWKTLRRERGWKTDVMVETHDGFCLTDNILRLQERLPEPVAILWDSHHTWKVRGESPAATWEKIGKWVHHVHVKDSISAPSARHPFTYVLPGQGEMPISEVWETLSRTRFAGCVSLEWEKHWHPYLPPLEEALRRAAAIAWW